MFLLIGSAFARGGIRRAAEDFLLVCATLVIGNTAIGMIDERYVVAEYIPFLVISFVPAAVVAAARYLVRASAERQLA